LKIEVLKNNFNH